MQNPYAKTLRLAHSSRDTRARTHTDTRMYIEREVKSLVYSVIKRSSVRVTMVSGFSMGPCRCWPVSLTSDDRYQRDVQKIKNPVYVVNNSRTTLSLRNAPVFPFAAWWFTLR
jgi:hypothetical protein